MKTPHKHAELIKAWADGAEIECRENEHRKWVAVHTPFWIDLAEYRVKPEPKPDVVKHAVVELWLGNVYIYTSKTDKPNLELTFDGETGKLKSAEVL